MQITQEQRLGEEKTKRSGGNNPIHDIVSLQYYLFLRGGKRERETPQGAKPPRERETRFPLEGLEGINA